jgi:hypothetical protein
MTVLAASMAARHAALTSGEKASSNAWPSAHNKAVETVV